MLSNGHIRKGEAAIGLFTFGLGAFIAIQTWMTPSIAAQSVVGPGLFPALIATGLIFVGLRLFYESYVKRVIAEEKLEFDWKAASIVAAVFAVQFLILEPVGWILSGTLMFAVSAVAFGSRSHVWNVFFGLALTTVTFLVFDYGLDLDLPIGSLFEDLITPTS